MSVEGKQSADNQVARATGAVSSMTLASRILGLVRDAVVASAFGAGLATDAFFVAFKVPNLLRRLVAEGSLSSAFVPVFTEELERSPEAGRSAIGAVSCFCFLLTSTLALLGILFAEEITLAFAPGFGVGSEKTVLASSLMQLMFPYIVLVSLLALAASTLNSLGVFAWPAAAPALLNISIICGALFFGSHFEQPIYALAYAVLIGGVIQLIPQLIVLRKLGFGLHFRNPLRSRAVRTLLFLMLPSILSASVYQLMIFINTLLASMLVEGSISWLYYADRMFQFPFGVFSVAIATAALPTLSRFAARGEKTAFDEHLTTVLRWTSFITIPATVGLMMLAEPLIATLFERGEFTASDTTKTAQALIAYSIGLWAASCYSIVNRAFLAKKDALTPSLITGLTILINIALAFVLMGPPETTPTSSFGIAIAELQHATYLYDLNHTGLALAGAISSFASLILLSLFLKRRSIELETKTIANTWFKSVLAAGAMAGALLGLQQCELGAFLEIAIGVPVGAIIYGLAALILKLPEAQTTCLFLRERLLRQSD